MATELTGAGRVAQTHVRLRPAGIVGVGSAVPDRVLTNEQLSQMVDTSDQWITERTGIKERRIAGPETATSDLAVTAAQRAIAGAGIAPEQIDMIIVATITPDLPFPATACIVGERLGIPGVPAFDLAAGCAGFVYALDVANRLVGSGAYEHVLIIGADLLSRYVDFSDRSTCVLFGDGAGAAIVAPVAAAHGVVATQLGADGRGVDKLYVPAGGTRLPLTAEGLDRRDNTIKMVGNEVFKFAVRILADATLDVLAQVDLEPADIDLFVPHQANVRIMDAAARRLGLPPEKVFANVARYGNTSAASIPIALDEAVSTGRLADGDLVALVGFGTGLAWAAALMYWGGRETAQ